MYYVSFQTKKINQHIWITLFIKAKLPKTGYNIHKICKNEKKRLFL